MINFWRDLEPGPKFPHLFSALVEVPQMGRTTYRYLRDVGAFKLDRVLTSAAHYPGDYGFVPQTLDSDGDPINLLVMTNLPTFPGCIIFAIYKYLDARHMQTAGWEDADADRAHLQAGFARFWEQRKRAAIAGDHAMAAMPAES